MTRNYNKNKNIKLGKVTADFATVASHQLRTPISVIRWSLDMLNSDKSGKLSKQQKYFITQAYEQNSFMARIVNDLLRVSRIEEGNVDVEIEKIEFKHLIKEVVNGNKQFATANNCQIQLKISGNLPKIHSDRLKVKQIINAFLDNSIRYSRRNCIIKIVVKSSKKNLLISFEDNGIGIPKKEHYRVFSKFFRAENAIRIQTSGLGLQLYIAKNYIDALGGKIKFKSAKNKGTIFYLKLPVRSERLTFKTADDSQFFLTGKALEYLYKHISVGLMVINFKHKIKMINDYAEEILNIKINESINKDLGKVINNKELLNFVSSKNAKKGIEDKRIIEINTGGKERYYQTTIIPIIVNTKVEGWMLIIYETNKSGNISENEIEELKREREFVSITVHELKSPLGIAKWGLEMLLSENSGPLNNNQKELISQIYSGNERLLVLVKDLLNLSKLQEGRFEVNIAPLDIGKVIKNVLKGFAVAVKDKRINLRLKMNNENIPKVAADFSRVTQALTNLLSNAVKYTPENGQVEVGVKAISAKKLNEISNKISLPINHKNNQKGYILIWVKDTGIGIDENQQKKIFTKFFRAKNVIQSEAEGTGLGLYITKSIINLHNGDIWFESVFKKGSTFYFTLPISN